MSRESVGRWVGSGELREVVMEMLGERNLKERGLFDPKAVSKLVEDVFIHRLRRLTQIIKNER